MYCFEIYEIGDNDDEEVKRIIIGVFIPFMTSQKSMKFY
jgi:hypothetical protein